MIINNDIDISSLNERIFYETICKILKEVRKEKNLTQEYIANKLGVTSQQYQKYESGINRFSLTYLIKICNLLDININELVDTCTSASTKGTEQKFINRNTIIHNHNNYGFFNSLITLIKEISMNINKRLFIGTIMVGIILAWGLNFLKYTPLNTIYSVQILAFQFSIAMIVVGILFCSVFPVSILTWIIVFTASLNTLFPIYSMFVAISAGAPTNVSHFPNIIVISAIIYSLSFIITIPIVMYLKHKEKKVS